MDWKPELAEFDKSQIVQRKWPKLMRWVKKIHTTIYLASSIPDKSDNNGVITLLIRQINGWELHSFDKGAIGVETEMKVRISEQMAAAIALKLLPESYKQQKQSYDKPGRPPKYTRDDVRAIHLMRQRGVPIRKIAEIKGMSASTVQRLLQQIETPAERQYIADRNRKMRKNNKA